MIVARLTPELEVEDLDQSLAFYTGVIGAIVLYARPEERFAFLELEGSNLMLEEAAGHVVLPMEERWYRRTDHDTGNRQFVVADPDGYLLRFFTDLGQRPCG